VKLFIPYDQAYADPNYVIFGLGPQNDDGLYSWAAITNGDDDRLFILARDIADFKANYEDDVIEFAKSRGFIFEGVLERGSNVSSKDGRKAQRLNVSCILKPVVMFHMTLCFGFR
jgi:lipocalin